MVPNIWLPVSTQRGWNSLHQKMWQSVLISMNLNQKKLSSHGIQRWWKGDCNTLHKHSKTVRLRLTEQLAFLKSAERENCWNVIGTYVRLFILLNFTLDILLRLARLGMTTTVEICSHTYREVWSFKVVKTYTNNIYNITICVPQKNIWKTSS
jgi:hypothetical protein